MAVLIDVLRTVSALNLVLLVGLLYVWGRSFLVFRSKHAAGLLVFAAILLLQNAVAVYFYAFDPAVSGWLISPVVKPRPRFVMTSLQVLEFGGLAFITWVSFD
jgi:glucose dehydrogenase